MHLKGTARASSVVESKSGACPKLDITEAAYVGMARCLIAPIINDRHLKPHSPIL
jgi:hypothetical protein